MAISWPLFRAYTSCSCAKGDSSRSCASAGGKNRKSAAGIAVIPTAHKSVYYILYFSKQYFWSKDWASHLSLKSSCDNTAFTWWLKTGTEINWGILRREFYKFGVTIEKSSDLCHCSPYTWTFGPLAQVYVGSSSKRQSLKYLSSSLFILDFKVQIQSLHWNCKPAVGAVGFQIQTTAQ